MSSDTSLTEADEGKQVVSTSGDNIGRIVEVTAGDAYVNPDPDLADTFKSKLGWGNRHIEDTYRLDPSNVDTITDDEVRVNL